MRRNPWLVAGLAFLLGLSACSKKTEKITAVGSYAPVITGLHMDHEPAVRGVPNQLTLLVTNVNQIPLRYHWRVENGTLQDSTSATVTWDAPDTIGTYPVYVSVEGTDVNEVPYFRQQTFLVYVDNEFERWTIGETVKFDVAPPGNQDPDPAHPVLYAEFENPGTGESHVVAVSSPLGATTPLSDGFFAAASPTLRADGGQIAFTGRALGQDPGQSLYLIPSSGAQTDTTNAIALSRYKPRDPQGRTVLILANPRFARAGTVLAYNSDSAFSNQFGIPFASNNNPHLYVRDVTNLAVAPQPLVTQAGQEANHTYWMGNWNPTSDSLVCVSYDQFNTLFQTARGIYRLGVLPPVQATGTVWLLDAQAQEIDWSPDGAHFAFTRKNAAGDRDIWIMRTDATDPSQAIRVTLGPADDAHPRFSSDGTKIYFVSNRADRYGLNGVFDTERRGYNVWTVSRFDRP